MKEYTVNRIKASELAQVDLSAAERASLCSNADGGEPEYGSRFALLHDGSNIYFEFDVTDPSPRATMRGYNEPIYDEEAVEFFFATEGRKEDYLELEFNCVGGVFAANIANDLNGHTSIAFIEKNPVESRVIATERGFRVIGKIDRSAFKGSVGNDWLFNAYRIKRREDGSMILSAFSPTYVENFHKPDYFARLKFN